MNHSINAGRVVPPFLLYKKYFFSVATTFKLRSNQLAQSNPPPRTATTNISLIITQPKFEYDLLTKG